MTNFLRVLFAISIACFSTYAAVAKSSDQLPQSITELKHYYDVINNLEKRGIINVDLADQEKRLYIRHASDLVGRKELLTLEEFLTWKQRQLIVSFSNVVAILAGVIVMLAAATFIGIFLGPFLTQVPLVVWEILGYVVSIGLMLCVSHSWLIFLGCLAFVGVLSYSVTKHVSDQYNLGLVLSWTCFIVWTFVAVYQQHREAGYLAIMALQSALGFSIAVGHLVTVIGFQNEKAVPSATLASFLLIMLGSILHLKQDTSFLSVPFSRPMLFLGTFVYFIGMLIMSSTLFKSWRQQKHIFWLLQIVMFLSGFAAMFFGPMLEIPFVQAIGGTMFVVWLLEKYVELVPWRGFLPVVGSLFGFGVLLYAFAFFLKTYPEYFIFHIYSKE
ncbi:unnamed protein product [Adineta ricciae]|uniref:DUF2157 domain-containing protein n=1 Tax=Adineta ricciae TaxID=249248 RepID=A0A814AJA1_ADIRI|nr:unnamed protein product [Adineta ricciae]CAF1153724.1 unnamed protein product [Adineta ricciae]